MEGKTRRRARCAVAAAAALLLLPLFAPSSRAATPSATQQVIIYRLKKGEGLSDVSRKFGVPLGTLIRMNRSRLPRPGDPSYVFTGMAVRVPVAASKAAPSAEKPVVSPKPAPGPVAKPGAKPAAAPVVVPEPATPAASLPSKPEQKQPATATAPQPAAPEKAAPEKAATPPVASGKAPVGPAVQEEEAETSAPAATAPAPPAPSGVPISTPEPWYRTAIAIVGAAAFALVLIVWYYLHQVVKHLKAVRGAEPGPLALVAQRELSKNASLFWVRAGEKDLFISTGPDTQILTSDPTPVPPPEPAAAAATPASRTSSPRRPRKEPPAPTSG